MDEGSLEQPPRLVSYDPRPSQKYTDVFYDDEYVEYEESHYSASVYQIFYPNIKSYATAAIDDADPVYVAIADNPSIRNKQAVDRLNLCAIRLYRMYSRR